MRISWVALAAIGCSSSTPAESPPAPTPPAPKATESPVAPPAKDVAPEARAAPPRPAPANAPSKEKLAEFRKRMNAGWKLQTEERWAESVPEFEAALVAVPADQRALTELGWSAMKAGDFDKARRADEEAVRVAIDKRVKAQGLYNLGQVLEKTGDKDGAQKSYVASIALRPNKTVEAALARLGKSPRAEQPFCAATAKACECIVAHAFGPSAQGTTCEAQTDKTGGRLTMIFPSVSGFRVYRTTSEHARWDYVLDEKSQLVAVVDGSYDHAGRTETVQLTKTILQSVAGKAVMRIETTTKASATRPIADAVDSEGKDAVELEDVETTAATLCVIGVGGKPTRCPLRDVPLLLSVVVERGKQTTRTETHAELTVSDEGVATVKQLKGPSDTSLSALVGPHRLW